MSASEDELRDRITELRDEAERLNVILDEVERLAADSASTDAQLIGALVKKRRAG